ncbi:hypothetical protein SM124_14120 [Bacillus sp. 31A1R]|uniref:Uncharacterized protein n=1 Tax=Robertmurraya mangrovi TaxID=3098077 RepID=A0ABU5J0C2_9BACI|nr:hypothetical protein [Bacillus sp. 31A1R]MDZ5472865.1 hypothetical protein [Bacillus sp. 31A1R]
MNIGMKKLRKGIVMSTVLACSLIFGSTVAGAESNVTNSKETQSFTQAASTVSKKGVLTFPKKYSMKKVTSELKPEAAKLMKIYAESLRTGKTKPFHTYVNKHVAEKSDDNWLIGRKYVRDGYSDKVKGMRKANSKDTLSTYSKEVKKVTTSKVKTSHTYKGSGFATFQYDFQPANFNAFGTVTVQFKFTQLKNGKYVLENVYFVY